MHPRISLSTALLPNAACATSAVAQDILREPGPPFKGTIGTTSKDSKADFPKPVTAPTGAPNVLIVILDDMGFGHAGTFGGAVATPTMDRLAREGLRYSEQVTIEVK